MNRIVMFTLFIVIACSIYFLMHFLVFKVLIKNIGLSSKWVQWLKIFFIFSGLSFPLSQFLSRLLKFYWLNFYAVVWLGIITTGFFIALLTLVVMKGLPLLGLAPGKERLIAAAALAILGMITVYSLFNGLRPPIIRKVIVPMRGLPQQLDGFSIVQISDMHLESFKSKKALPAIVERVNALKPDLVVSTGDLIEGDIVDDHPVFVDELKKLKAVYGVVAVTGNHEFFSGIENFLKLGEKANITILRNQRLELAAGLQVIGIDDDQGRQFSRDKRGPELDELIRECDPGKPIILLYHRPLRFDEAVAQGVDLQLSGHTHGGQIPPIDLLVQLIYKYPNGLYGKEGAFIYTSLGTGYWGPPMRFLNRAEITHIVLKSSQ